jgi:hypothetical protein
MPGTCTLLAKLSCDTWGIMPRDVLPMKAGVRMGLRPASDRRPRRGARAPVVLSRANSIISAGNWSSLWAWAASAMVKTGWNARLAE